MQMSWAEGGFNYICLSHVKCCDVNNITSQISNLEMVLFSFINCSMTLAAAKLSTNNTSILQKFPIFLPSSERNISIGDIGRKWSSPPYNYPHHPYQVIGLWNYEATHAVDYVAIVRQTWFESSHRTRDCCVMISSRQRSTAPLTMFRFALSNYGTCITLELRGNSRSQPCGNCSADSNHRTRTSWLMRYDQLSPGLGCTIRP